MKIGYVIGALDAGGSERQLTLLAPAMQQAGHDVSVISYVGPGIFDRYLQRAGVHHRVEHGTSQLDKVRMVRKWINEFEPDVVHAFLSRCSAVAILADLPKRRHGIVATDFSTAAYNRLKPQIWGSLGLFHLADAIVTESSCNALGITRLAPLLRNKIHIVQNGVDTIRFRPVVTQSQAPHDNQKFRFLAVGSVCRIKNPVRVVHACELLRQRNTRPFELTWAGRTRHDSPRDARHSYNEAISAVKAYGLQDHVKFIGHVDAIEKQYATHHALVHVSIQEGLPNAVIEAMASGLPVVTSRVSDLPTILHEAQNGFVCNGYDPASIASALDKMLLCSPEHYRTMSERSFQYAQTRFSVERFVSDMQNIYHDIIRTRIARANSYVKQKNV